MLIYMQPQVARVSSVHLYHLYYLIGKQALCNLVVVQCACSYQALHEATGRTGSGSTSAIIGQCALLVPATTVTKSCMQIALHQLPLHVAYAVIYVRVGMPCE